MSLVLVLCVFGVCSYSFKGRLLVLYFSLVAPAMTVLHARYVMYLCSLQMMMSMTRAMTSIWNVAVGRM